jgi:hypothetical protein
LLGVRHTATVWKREGGGCGFVPIITSILSGGVVYLPGAAVPGCLSGWLVGWAIYAAAEVAVYRGWAWTSGVNGRAGVERAARVGWEDDAALHLSILSIL